MTQQIDLSTITLKQGKHASFAQGACLLEAVSYVAGEPYTDHPQCVCPVLAAFGCQLNDRMPSDETRTRYLAPMIPPLVGTRSSRAVELRRMFAPTDWAVRTAAPLALEALGRTGDAATLRALAPIVDRATAKDGQSATKTAADASYAASYAASDAAPVWQSAADLLARLCEMREGDDDVAPGGSNG